LILAFIFFLGSTVFESSSRIVRIIPPTAIDRRSSGGALAGITSSLPWAVNRCVTEKKSTKTKVKSTAQWPTARQRFDFGPPLSANAEWSDADLYELLSELARAPNSRGDEYSYDMHSLLEENALLRRILVKMDLVLKKVVDPK
jgi:hypothetical protein